MSGSDCSLHPRSKACALCVVFCLVINVHPNYSSRISPNSAEAGHRIARSTTTDTEGDHGKLGDRSLHGGGDGYHAQSIDSVVGAGGDHKDGDKSETGAISQTNNPVFLREIFEKYGKDGVMSFEGFQKLIKNLHIGSMVRGYGEEGDPHLAGGNQRDQHHYEHHMSDYDDYEYHSSHAEAHEPGDHSLTHGPTPQPLLKDHTFEHDHAHSPSEGEGGVDSKNQTQTRLSAHSSGQKLAQSDAQHRAAAPSDSAQHSIGGEPNPSSQPQLKSSPTLLNHTKSTDTDSHEMASQARFRSRRLSSLRPHRSSPLSDAHRQPSHQGGRSKRHPLRHWHQRQSSNRNMHKLVNQGGDGEHAANAKRVKRQASDPHVQCMSPISLLNMHKMDLDSPITPQDFINLCPALLQQIDAHVCIKPNPPAESDHAHSEDSHAHDHEGHNHTLPHSEYHVTGEVWMYAFLAVGVISMVGLLGVAVVPIMQKVFYNHLLQFLVALAIGTLTGDAILHLIPHALSAAHAHGGGGHGGSLNNASDSSSSGHQDEEERHLMATWRALAVLAGVYLFFITERLMEIIATRRRAAERNRVREDNCNGSPKLYRTVEEHESEVGAKLSKHSDVVTSCEEIVMVVHPGKDVRNMAEDMHEELHRDCEPEERDQLNHSHAPLHSHGHSHGPLPKTISAVAWMVIMGDGIHNFSDGLAIGAAFANSLPGGLSTTVAVFCHELPHEIGDFAVLLRAGMSVKQAMMYNCVSSILCLFGMIVGVCVGNIDGVSLWIFALAGGMFIYIALVDMLPELKNINPRKGENPFVHLGLQNLGMLTGAAIMLLIALYIDNIKLPNMEP